MAGLGGEEVRLEARKFYHILFGIVENSKLVVFFQKRAMVQIEEAEVPCSYSAASLVHVHVILDFAEPVEGLGDQDVLFEEDAALFV